MMATITGKWKFDEVVDVSVAAGLREMVTFRNNGTNYIEIAVVFNTGWYSIMIQDSEGKYTTIGFSEFEGSTNVRLDPRYRIFDFSANSNITTYISDTLATLISTNGVAYNPTIAELLAVVAENQQKVFDAGRAAGGGGDYPRAEDNVF